ncbi:MAG: zf-TFIIB domain-containing protein [Xanthomonadales bacterium]|nr:zf-TFIIB domain-containing protein [Xanthomonadales bacterium]
MLCPKCHAAMEHVVIDNTQVDRCTECRGLWFDLEEHEELKAHADALDTGDPALGSLQNAIDRIRCPICPGDQLMIRMVDPKQPHIWFESCGVCHGRFYDAGEFKDFADFTVAEWFRSLRSTPRP